MKGRHAVMGRIDPAFAIDYTSNRQMRIWPPGVIWVFLGIVAGGDAMGEEMISPMESAFVPTAEYAKVVRQALDGSSEAALRLERQYSLTARHAEAIFWATIAAENGSQDGVYRLAFTLAHSPHRDQRRRARYWLKKLIARGGEMGKDATVLLAELDERERTKKTDVVANPERYPKW